MIYGLGLSLVFSGLMCWHAVRSGQQLYWLFIILAFQPLGGIVYGAIYVLPEIFGGTTARRIGQAATKALDPEREYRTAKALVDDSPTVGNQMRMASAAEGLGRHAEAERLYAEAAQGIHAEDPTLLLGRARALVELERFEESLPLFDKLGELGEAGRTPQAALLMGRTYEALGRTAEADTAYGWAAGRMPGMEGLARYAAFLAGIGRRAEAEEALAELEKRAKRSTGQFRAEAKAWRDYAAQALGR